MRILKNIGIGIGLVVLVAIAAFLYAISVEPWGDRETESGISSRTAEAFTERMQSRVIDSIGQPIEGFEPFMFLQAFPGLERADFNGVDALIGGYRIEDGRIVYDLMGEEELHSAARAISGAGMETLLANISGRLGIDLERADALKNIFAALEAPRGVPEGWSEYAGERFSVFYPDAFEVQEDGAERFSEEFWSQLSELSGESHVTLYLPSTYQPGTNFSEAWVHVGSSEVIAALDACTQPENAGEEEETAIQNVPFQVFSTTDAGAGNIYETKSYRTLRKGVCYAIETVVHTTNIGTEPAGAVEPYDADAVGALLEQVVATFTFR